MASGISAAEMLLRLESFDPIAATRQAVEANPEPIADLIRGQLIEGLDSTGQKMPDYANANYARQKYALNPKAGLGTRDQRKSGGFYSGIYVKAGASAAEYGSNSASAKYVEQQQRGNLVLGMNPASVGIFRVQTLQDFLLRALQQTINR